MSDTAHTNGSRTVVLIHGAFADGSSWNDVIERLQTKSVKVTAPANPLPGISSDSAYLASLLDQIAGPVVAVGHSYGGAVITNAASVATNVVALLDALELESAILAGFDWGARSADIVAAVWPERCSGLVSVSGSLIVNLEANQPPLPPKAELGRWYQYYFATERGRHGYSENRREFNKVIWQLASPKWNFDDATYDRTAASFGDPDHVDIVIHNYRWRLSLADGERQYDELEARLFENPVITVPTITIGSDFDGTGADGHAYAQRFSGPYSHRVLEGIGHNVPQEAPGAFADAILEVGAAR